MSENEELNMSPAEMPANPPFFKTIRRVLSYITGKFKLLLGIVSGCIILSSVTAVLSNTFVGKLIGNYIEPLVAQIVESGEGTVNYSGLAIFILMYALIYALSIVADYISAQVMSRVSTNVLFNVRHDLFKHMQNLPISFFDTHSYGEVMSHYTNDVDALESLVSRGFFSAFSSVVTVIGYIVGMFVISWQLAIPVLAVTFVSLYFIGKLGGKSAKFFMKQMESIGDVNGYVEELVNGQKIVKVFTYEKCTQAVFDKKNDELCDNTTNASLFASIMMPLTNGITIFLYVLVALIGGFLAIECNVSVITIGVIASFLQMTRSIIEPISTMTGLVSGINMAAAGAGRVFQLMDETSETDKGDVSLVRCKRVNGDLVEVPEHDAFKGRNNIWAWKVPDYNGDSTYTELRGSIDLIDVSFSYDGEKQVLFDVSVYAEMGEKIAFVGSTGAGKTTITNLINRFYDIEEGRIQFDSIEINRIKKTDLRKSLGIVLQETNLFTGSVMDNIRYGNLHASDEECIQAAKLANADVFIRKLPQGYDTLLTSNGTELSQGQRQLIAIARAAVANPPVLIMDEATSSIDTRTEALVQRGMDALMENRTVFVIAHRLSTVKNSDAIFVLENGRIIECGNHESLIDDRGKYYQLYTGTFELE